MGLQLSGTNPYGIVRQVLSWKRSPIDLARCVGESALKGAPLGNAPAFHKTISVCSPRAAVRSVCWAGWGWYTPGC